MEQGREATGRGGSCGLPPIMEGLQKGSARQSLDGRCWGWHPETAEREGPIPVEINDIYLRTYL